MPALVGRNRALLASRRGGGFSLDAFMAAQSDGLWFDATKTDRFFQENIGPTLADDVGEAIGLALDQRTWGGKTLAQQMSQAVDILGGAGAFSSSSGWSLNTGWTIGSNVLSVSAAAFTVASNAVAPVAGALYQVTYEITAYTSGAVRAAFLTGSQVSGTARSAIGSYTEYLLAVTGNTQIALQATGSGFVGTIDNFTVKLVPGNHGIQATGTLKPSRQTAGAKFDGSGDNWLTPYLPGSGATFIVARATVPASLAGTQVLYGVFDGSNNGSYLAITSSGLVRFRSGQTTIDGNIDVRGQTIVFGCTSAGTGGAMSIFVDAAANTAGTQSGSTPAVAARVGALNNNGTAAYFYSEAVKGLVAGREALDLARYLQIRQALLAA